MFYRTLKLIPKLVFLMQKYRPCFFCKIVFRWVVSGERQMVVSVGGNDKNVALKQLILEIGLLNYRRSNVQVTSLIQAISKINGKLRG